MGDGSRISFWQDKWLPSRPLALTMGSGFARKLGLPLDLSVREFYLTACWNSFIAGSADRRNKAVSSYLRRLAVWIPSSLPNSNL